MFEGIIEQIKPWGKHCQGEFNRLMQQLKDIQVSVDNAGEDPFDQRLFIRLAGTGDFAPDPGVPLFTVPLGQAYEIESVVLNMPVGASARVVLHEQPTAQGSPIFAGHLDSAGSFGARGGTWTPNTVIPAQTPVWTTITDTTGGAWSLYVQVRAIQVPSNRPPTGTDTEKAHSGSGSPEGMTSAQGPPLHETGRDMLDVAPYVPVLR